MSGPRRRGALRLYLLRHGEPDCTDLFYGHHDVALSERGRAQARAQAQMLRDVPLSAIHSSDLTRTRTGAAMLAESRDGPGARVVEHAALREMYLGALEGLPVREARARFPEVASLRYAELLDTRVPGGGESVRDVSARVLPALREIVAPHLRADPEPGGRPAVAVVAHNTVIRVILAHCAGLGPEGYTRFRQSCGAVSRIDVERPADGATWSQLATIAFCNVRP